MAEGSRGDLRNHLLLLALVCGLCFFWRLGSYGLFDLDEGLYVAAARETHLTGDLVTPRVNGEPFFEKPPLIYWCAALMFRLFGVNEFTARLPAALATTGLAFLIYVFGRRLFGARSGLLAALFFALSPLVLGAARELTTDAMLDLWIACALFAYFLAYTSDSPGGKRWYYGFWAACGMGTLTKGIVALILPGAIALVFLALAERFQWRAVLARVVESRLPTGLLFYFAIALPWHVAAYRASGSAFWHEYVVRQHLQRFRGGDTSHHAPFTFYVPTFLLGFFPWSVFTPPAFLAPSDGARYPAALARTLLKVWTAFIFMFFSISGSKLVSYILPMFAPAALLTGDWCAQAIDRKEARRPLVGGAIAAFALSLLVLLAVLAREWIARIVESSTHRPARLDQVAAPLFAWAEHLLLAATVATAACLLLLLLNRRRHAFITLAAGMALFMAIAVSEGLSAIDDAFLAPLRSVVAAARRHSQGVTPIVLNIGPPRRPSALFYLDPAKGRGGEAGAFYAREINDEARVRDYLQGNRPALIVTDHRREALLTADPSVRVIARSGPWSLLRAEPPAPKAAR